MNKPMTSWMVPFGSFVLAIVLAIVAGPKSKALARVPATPTGAGDCIDLHDLFGVTLIGPKRIIASTDIGFKHGFVATRTDNTVGYTCKIALKYKVMSGGVEVTRPLDVELNRRPGHWEQEETDVVDEKVAALFDTTLTELDKAIRGASHRLPHSETFVGEDLTARNPMIFKFHFHGITKKKPGGLPICTDDLDHTVPTPINAAGFGDAIVEKAQ